MGVNWCSSTKKMLLCPLTPEDNVLMVFYPGDTLRVASHVEEMFYTVRIAPTPAFASHTRPTVAADLVPVGCLWAHHRGVEVPAALYVTCRLRFRRKKITAVIFIIALPQPLFLWFILPEEISFLYHLTFLDIAAWTKFMSRIKLCPCFIESRYFS